MTFDRSLYELLRQLKEADYNIQDVEYLKRTFQDYYLQPGQCLYVVHYPLNEIIIAKGFDSFLGYRKSITDPNFVLDIIHPEDLPKVAKISAAAVKMVTNERDDLLIDYRLSVEYRIRKKNGSYIRILRQTSILKHDRRLVATFSLISKTVKQSNNLPVTWKTDGELSTKFSDIINGSSENGTQSRSTRFMQ